MRSSIKVWDPVVRIGHWLLAVSILVAWLTREGGRWHEWVGYASLAVVAVRVFWGFSGPKPARFTSFVRSPALTWGYAREALRARESRHVGHNPLGAWMILALLLCAAVVGLSAWLYTTDRYWGVQWVETMRAQFTNLLLLLVGLHVAGVLVASFRHRENLIAAMFHGRKRASDGTAGDGY